MKLISHDFTETQHKALKDYCHNVIGCMQDVHNELGPALPEYIYQEALFRKLKKEGFNVQKEFVFHPVFEGETLDSYIKMDLVILQDRGNIIIECKSISELQNREQLQLFGYLSATHFPVGILVNFGSYPKAQIERYMYKEDKISAF